MTAAAPAAAATASSTAAPPPARRRAWTCASCGVVARRLDDEPHEPPAGWVRGGGGLACLACARARARLEARLGGGEALELAIDAELKRGVAINEVAKHTGADPLAVRKRRTSLVRAGEVAPPVAKRRRRKDPTEPTLEALRRLGAADIRTLAEATGASRTSVARHLRALVTAGKAEAQAKGSGRDSARKLHRPT